MKLIGVLLLLTACATSPEKKFSGYLESKQCEEAALHLPNFSARKATSNAKSVVGTGASYIVTGTAYGVDVVYYLTGGILFPLAICSPLLMANDHGKGMSGCFDIVSTSMDITDAFPESKLGKKTYDSTQGWRCPDLSFAVKDMAKISDCYVARNEPDKATAQLKSILDPKVIGGCISSDDKKFVEGKLKNLLPAPEPVQP